MDDAAFDGTTYKSARLMTLLLERVLARGSFPEPSKSIFILDSSAKKETENQVFEAKGLRVNVVPGNQYLGSYVGPSEESNDCVRLQIYN